MKVNVARTAGFCMGVSRAVSLAEKEAKSVGEVYTLGELIHNRQVVCELAAAGVKVATDLPESGTVIIRAHGVELALRQKLSSLGVRVVDATCPHVVSSQDKIASYSFSGGTVVISGDSEHPEVRGLCGYAQGKVIVVDTLQKLESLELPQNFLLISQTTFSKNIFQQMEFYVAANFPHAVIVNSICNATELRQKEVAKLASESDLLVVVGGKHSANTLRLVEIGVSAGRRVIHVETAAELNAQDFDALERVSVTAGASTPASAIAEVVEFLRALK